jgi:hypothetical protein
MNNAKWITGSTSTWPYGAILTYFDESESYLDALNAHWLHVFVTAALFSAVVLGLYICGRFVSPRVPLFTSRRNSYDPAKQ